MTLCAVSYLPFFFTVGPAFVFGVAVGVGIVLGAAAMDDETPDQITRDEFDND